jgi:hypothetical protein
MLNEEELNVFHLDLEHKDIHSCLIFNTALTEIVRTMRQDKKIKRYPD